MAIDLKDITQKDLDILQLPTGIKIDKIDYDIIEIRTDLHRCFLQVSIFYLDELKILLNNL